MRQALSKGMLSAAAATSILSLSGAHAFAASEANGQALDSPGLLSGNSVQAPLDVPVNVCGNTANGVAAGNPATGNGCASAGHSAAPAEERLAPAPGRSEQSSSTSRTAHAAPAAPRPGEDPTGSSAHGDAAHSPGVLAGNDVQVPLHVPVNVCGNGVGVVALLSGVFGNHCESAPQDTPDTVTPPAVTPPQGPDPRPRAVPPVPRPEIPHQVTPPAPHHAPHGERAERPVHAA
ncbi:chaplin, partial [Streptomyces sp. NPDC047123]|uniref:chaplin n=1 Tax=Streptomyces sp. NPDC047123 TaxID=3155622 RepID=UPI003406057D